MASREKIQARTRTMIQKFDEKMELKDVHDSQTDEKTGKPIQLSDNKQKVDNK